MAATEVPIEIALDGVSGTATTVYVPIQSQGDIVGGYQEIVTQKLGNDPNADITTRLSTFPIVLNLSGGAWNKFFDPNANQYFEPVFTAGTASQPLAWTANPEAPLMPGCANTDKSGSYAFSQFVYYGSDNRIYGLDTKGDKLWKSDAGLTTIATTDTAIGGAGNITEIALNALATNIYVGRSTGNAFRWDGSSHDFGKAAQHFVNVGKNFFYSDGRNVKWNGNESTFNVAVGLPDTNVKCMLYWNTYILVGKPEGIFVLNPRNKNFDQIFYSNDTAGTNCNFLTLHGNTVFFAAGQGFFEYDGKNVLPKNFAQFDGNKNRFFYGGKVLNAYSDGRNLWLVFQVQTSDTTPVYNSFIVMMTPRTNGFHPVYVSSSTTNPSYIPRGLFFINNKLHYSLGNDNGGYLLTDGAVPMSATGSPYTWDVGITTGWADMSRDWVTKWLYGARTTTKDTGSTSRYDFYYMKWNDTSWTQFPSSPTGTNDNVLVQPTAESGLQSGFVTTKVNAKLILHNTGNSTAQESVAALNSFHWIGQPVYDAAYQVTITATLYLDEEAYNPYKQRYYNGATIYSALKTAMEQNTPVTITMPDGTQFLGTIDPIGNGDRIDTMDTDTNKQGKPKIRKFSFLFTEYR